MILFYVHLILSFFCPTEAKPRAVPLKIAILYYTPVDQKLKAELIQNVTATYHCTVTEIKGIAALPGAVYYKTRNSYRATGLLTDLSAYRGYDKIIGDFGGAIVRAIYKKARELGIDLYA